MNPTDFNSSPSTSEIIDEWAETNPDMPERGTEDWSTMLARRMARLPREKKARRMYYDLFEFRCR